MIVLARIYPLKAILDSILLKRLPIHYSKRSLIEDNLYREEAGYKGEKALDYFLRFLPEEQYYIFQHIRLKIDQFTFQIDLLLLTTKYAIIIEAKYLGGSLHFDQKFNQLIQNHHDKRKVYDDPIAQAERQKRLLIKWLKKHFPSPLPINFIVVMSNTNALLTTDSHEIPKKVCKPYKIINKIEEIECNYQKEVINLKDLKKLCKLLLKHHSPEQYNILEEYKIPLDDILPGAICPRCDHLPMKYRNGKWHCSKCNMISKDAHIAAIEQYFLLVKPFITNSEFRWFLQLPSSNIAQKLLSQMNLPSTGTTRNRIYYQRGYKP